MKRTISKWKQCQWSWVAMLALGAGSLAAPLVRAESGRFITEEKAADLYRQGWIDLNKNGVKDPYENPAVEVEARITDLLKRMTVEEKTAQLATLYGYPRVLTDELPNEKWLTASWKDGIGNIDEHSNGVIRANVPPPQYAWPLAQHVRARNEVQRFFVEKTRLGIPVDFTNEATRGLAHVKTTSFPAPIALGSTWNTDLVHEIGAVIGREARALGYTNVYSPTLDLARDPRWGRTPDCFGEDPFLVGELGVAQVRGIQEQRVVATLKHFVLYSSDRGARDSPLGRNDPQLSWRDVQTLYLTPFRRAIREAGALGVMSSFNDYDGVPVQSSSQFLTDILRREYGFKGYVVSDSGAVEQLATKHRVAADHLEAVQQSVLAGLNVRTSFTPPEVYLTPLRQLAKEGKLPAAIIDARVRDILRVKFWLGLFEEPYQSDPAKADRVVHGSEHNAVALRAAHESIILLKNEKNLLPLRKDLRTVLVAGPLANDGEAWRNRYGSQRIDYVTVLNGVRKKLGASCEVRALRGCPVVDSNFPESDAVKEPPSAKVTDEIAATVAAAKGAEVVILVVGENDDICKESRGRASLDLPGDQDALVRALKATGVPVVLVLSNGRPLSINWAAKNVPAIVEAWFPGEAGGDAIADVLFGDYNPAGRLPITVPRGIGFLPVCFPSHFGSSAPDAGQGNGVLFPFGYGLSYTTFSYANLRITPEQQGPTGKIEVAVDVTNTGARVGDEVVQLYVRDELASVVGFDKLLRGFRRVNLLPGETKTVRFTLTSEHLELYDRMQRWTVEAGKFTVMVGPSSEKTALEGTFTITGTAP